MERTDQRQATHQDGPKRHPPITVDVNRGPVVESRHVVYGVVLDARDDAEGALMGTQGEAWGDATLLTVARSALKPWQVLPLVLDGAADAFSLGNREIALACGSHSAQQEHLQVLKGFMEKTRVQAPMLQCPGHPPIDAASAKNVGMDWSRIHDNCSGKHTGMIAWCHHAGYDPAGYTKAEHPVQERILGLVSRLSGIERNQLPISVDGCRVPTPGLPLAAPARLFLLLGHPGLVHSLDDSGSDEPAHLEEGLKRVADAMAAEPLMVAGSKRADTDVSVATGGRIITKIGAEGVWGGVDREKQVAFAFKTIDGAARAVVPAGLHVLRQTGTITDDEAARLSHHVEPSIRDRADNKVGRIMVHLP